MCCEQSCTFVLKDDVSIWGLCSLEMWHSAISSFPLSAVKILEPTISTSHDIRWEIIIHGIVFQEAVKPHKCVPFCILYLLTCGKQDPNRLTGVQKLVSSACHCVQFQVEQQFSACCLPCWQFLVRHCKTGGVCSYCTAGVKLIDSACGIIVFLCDKFSHSVLAKWNIIVSHFVAMVCE